MWPNCAAKAARSAPRASIRVAEWKPIFEHPLVKPLTGQVNGSIMLRGFADLIDQPEKDKIRIIDIKTSAKSPNMEQANRALELTVYAYLRACQLGFHLEVPVSALYLVRTVDQPAC